MVMTRSKRAKRIVRSLSLAQHEDHVLSAFTPLLIRYNLLHNYHRCIQVSVDVGWPSDRVPMTSPYGTLPNFLRSQLDAQKITDGTRLWSQVVPLLTFIQSNIRRLGKSRGYPTLFVWHSRENHRSYFFFAFVEIKMVSKTYSIRELVRMRNSSASKEFYDRLYDKLQRDPSFGDIFRMSSDRSLPLIREEELDIVGVSDRPIMKRDSAKVIAARQLDGTDYEWKYRGRSESEEAVPRPICSPVGLSAQKDEGFQRFYKAVVSPTHVRVTAGGRIVPNTRGVPSPTAKLAKERLNGDSRTSSRPESRSNLENTPFSIPQVAYGQVPGTSNAAPPLQNDRQGDAANSENASTMHLSPPEQFDRNRPFFYNGQWMMPPGTLYPHGAMPHVAGFPVALPGQPSMGPKPSAYPWMHLQAMRSDPSMNTQVPPQCTTSGYGGTLHMPVSSILQSEITKKQLAHLRQHLKNAEDQLLYNKHQIDERATEQSIENLRHQIKLFENNLEQALAKEESLKPKTDDGAVLTTDSSARDDFALKGPSAGDRRTFNEPRSEMTSYDGMSSARSVNNHKGKDRMSSPLPSGSSAAQPTPLKSALKKPRSTEPIRKGSSLPVSAALAPPFQPRTDGTASAAATDTSAASGENLMFADNTYPSIDSHGLVSKPYLVGTIRAGCDPTLASDADYIYERELTEDELRARHLFWGNTPRSLQRGLPKFDGKDFYPPSPVRANMVEPKLRRPIPIGQIQTDHDLSKTKADSDPFGSMGRYSLRSSRNLTQSEQLPSFQSPVAASPASSNVSPVKRNMQPGRYDDFRKALGDAFSGSTNEHTEKSSPDSGDDASLLFKGRRNASINRAKNSHEFLTSMFKKSKSSSVAVPGTISSTTARGVLPHYAGHATASLTPAIANTPNGRKEPGRKAAETGDLDRRGIDEMSKVENLPLNSSHHKGPITRANG
ncbi:hypothetical protein JDV02_005986 [Purpureocillium takamizusanense]|uniref:Uncharacterized protein n=1 Tax=Purpureocillium takamizusanense TaxID=2060973 RepID=A0A9Q8QFG0_9HYPO|nr:uncharacterized protein JDV02_005986 [Purpureocillium takamizusanense]UNI19839.1 hypothetical protein JDV02_005986 [Purpureocillium takamizusanense]